MAYLICNLIMVVMAHALLDCSSRITSKFSNNLICRAFALEVLNTYNDNNNCNFSCQTHEKPVKNVSTIMTNIFFNKTFFSVDRVLRK